MRPGYKFVANDIFEYDIFVPTTSANCSGAVDLELSDGTSLRDSSAVDQNNIGVHPSTYLGAYASGTWYHRGINIPTSMQNKSINAVTLALEGDTGTNEIYVKDIRITNNGITKFAFHNNTKHANFCNRTFVAADSYYTENAVGGIKLEHTHKLNITGSTNVTINSLRATKVVTISNINSMVADDMSTGTVTATFYDNDNRVVTTTTNTVTFTLEGQGGTWDDGTTASKIRAPVDGVVTVKVKSSKKTGGFKVGATAIAP
jgi:hypothetical protein